LYIGKTSYHEGKKEKARKIFHTPKFRTYLRLQKLSFMSSYYGRVCNPLFNDKSAGLVLNDNKKERGQLK
jgi:hypothetical protein